MALHLLMLLFSWLANHFPVFFSRLLPNICTKILSSCPQWNIVFQYMRRCIPSQVVPSYFSTFGIWKFGDNTPSGRIQRSLKSIEMWNCPPFISFTYTVSLASFALVSSSLGVAAIFFSFLLNVDCPYYSFKLKREWCSGCMCVVVRSGAVTQMRPYV